MTRALLLVLLAVFVMDAALADGPKIIASGEWSKSVSDKDGYALRGRLLLCEKVVAEGRREVAVYLELQDACDFIGHGMQIWCELGRHDFRPEYKAGLRCEMRDRAGNRIEPQGFPFGGAVPQNQWVRLPVDATIRLRTSPFGIHREGALAVCPDLAGMWVIVDDDQREYLLSGTFTSDPPADQQPPAGSLHVWRGTLDLPPMQIFSRGVQRRAQ